MEAILATDHCTEGNKKIHKSGDFMNPNIKLQCSTE